MTHLERVKEAVPFDMEKTSLRIEYPKFTAASDTLSYQLWKDIPSPAREHVFEKMEALIKNILVMDSLNDWRACPPAVKEWFNAEGGDEVMYDWIRSHIEV